MDCPRCKKPMTPVNVDSVEVDLCRACEGLWFDKDELTAVMEDSGESAKLSAVGASWEGPQGPAEKAGERLLDCPRCREKLERYFYQTSGPALIDGCRAGCGVWLDDSELQKIYRYWAESVKPFTAEEKAGLAARFAAYEGQQDRKEQLFVDGLTRLDDQPGLMGMGGKVLQAIYTGFYKAGLR